MMTLADGRYRTLLDASAALADQPTIKAALRTLRNVLSSISKVHGADLYVLDNDGNNFRLLDFDNEHDAPGIQIGSRIPFAGPAAEVFEDQKPVYMPDLWQEISEIPDLAPLAAASAGR